VFFQQKETHQIVPAFYSVIRQIQNLAVLSGENKVASSIDFRDVIKDFTALKSRKVQF
jgi:hypothetical protein